MHCWKCSPERKNTKASFLWYRPYNVAAQPWILLQAYQYNCQFNQAVGLISFFGFFGFFLVFLMKCSRGQQSVTVTGHGFKKKESTHRETHKRKEINQGTLHYKEKTHPHQQQAGYSTSANSGSQRQAVPIKHNISRLVRAILPARCVCVIARKAAAPLPSLCPTCPWGEPLSSGSSRCWKKRGVRWWWWWWCRLRGGFYAQKAGCGTINGMKHTVMHAHTRTHTLNQSWVK